MNLEGIHAKTGPGVWFLMLMRLPRLLRGTEFNGALFEIEIEVVVKSVPHDTSDAVMFTR